MTDHCGEEYWRHWVPEIRLSLWQRMGLAVTTAMAGLCRSPFGWVLWNPILKVHKRRWGSKSRDGGECPYLNDVPANGETVGAIFHSIHSVFGWGFLSGYRHDGTRLIAAPPGSKRSVIPVRLWGRVELRSHQCH